MLFFTRIMPNSADNDHEVWSVLFEAKPTCLSAGVRNVIGEGLRDLYGSMLEEMPGDRLAELVAALGEAELPSKVSNAR